MKSRKICTNVISFKFESNREVVMTETDVCFSRLECDRRRYLCQHVSWRIYYRYFCLTDPTVTRKACLSVYSRDEDDDCEFSSQHSEIHDDSDTQSMYLYGRESISENRYENRITVVTTIRDVYVCLAIFGIIFSHGNKHSNKDGNTHSFDILCEDVAKISFQSDLPFSRRKLRNFGLHSPWSHPWFLIWSLCCWETNGSISCCCQKGLVSFRQKFL